MSKQTNILPKHASFRTLCYRGFCVFCLLLERFGKISFKNGLCRLFCGIALAADGSELPMDGRKSSIVAGSKGAVYEALRIING